MNFQVPQFIEVEDKVVGPLTFKQFIYLAGGAGLAFVFYAMLGWYLGMVPIILVLAFSFALAFYKINDRPFIYMAEAYIRYLASNKLYIWKKNLHQPTIKKSSGPNEGALKTSRPDLPHNKLHELSWNLNVKEISEAQNK